MTKDEALKLAQEALEQSHPEAYRHTITAIREALAEQPAQQQKEGFASPGGGYVPAIPRPIPLDWKLVPRKATPEMLRAMDECAQEGYDERLYEGMASSVYMAAWDASPVLGTLPTSKEEMSMMDMIVGNLVREGINKHRARELAEHFIKQCNYTNGYCTGRTDLLAEQKAQQEPVGHGGRPMTLRECMEAEEPASKQEPVAWATMVGDFAHVRWGSERPNYPIPYEVPLYTTPPQRKPLTDEQIMEMYNEPRSDAEMIEFARAIEAAHGIKENT